MICTATVLATLARDAAEDVFDGLTTDCTEPHRLPPRERNTMPRNASKSRPDARYTTELVPTMPLPHAPAPAPAPAPAADAATGERTQAPDWRARALEAEARVDSIDAELGRTYRDLDAACLDRDRLALEVAALRGAMPDADMLQRAATNAVKLGALSDADVEALYVAAADIRALSATPPAAEAVTGAGEAGK